MMSLSVQLLFGGWNAYDLPKTIEAIEPFINAVKGQEPIPPWVITMVRILNEQGSPMFDSGKPGMCFLVFILSDE